MLSFGDEYITDVKYFIQRLIAVSCFLMINSGIYYDVGSITYGFVRIGALRGHRLGHRLGYRLG